MVHHFLLIDNTVHILTKYVISGLFIFFWPIKRHEYSIMKWCDSIYAIADNYRELRTLS